MKAEQEKLSSKLKVAEQQKPEPEENELSAFAAHPDTDSAGAGGMVSPD
ncbi:hypothetical protein [Bacillus badius]|uniref:Uncharacterized protein n=1 Tax=Bacillus badius TaxID=1455 RepID=A0ABR5AQZ7_BACBA|nr:hypothetical protein [Bacillus badius]KIL72672.1 hypothetical protein SD78_4257 [Bacillus badius]KIL77172.1 hypothetical protein SD77_1777 [Bacillus badius]MED4716751.1 hypothetical protein [Bacillus badius]